MKIKNIINSFLLLSRAERDGALVLLSIIVILLIVRLLLPVIIPQNTDRKFEFEQNMEGLNSPERVMTEGYKQEKPGQKKENGSNYFKKNKTIRANEVTVKVETELFEFNPNEATYDDLIALGFSSYAAKNLISYREKGGKLRNPEDIMKVYGVDSTFYTRLLPYIKIPVGRHIGKELIEINGADSALLTTLDGVGPVLASRICKYRNQLGGFYSKDQLREVYQLTSETYEQIESQLRVDPGNIKCMNVNFAGIEDLKKHPYCKYHNARKIVDYRSSHGFIDSLNLLIKDSVVDSTTFKRLSPYLKID